MRTRWYTISPPNLFSVHYRLQQHASEVRQLAAFRQAVDEVPALGVHVLPVALDDVLSAAQISQQQGLLSGDALVVAIMQANRITQLASHDADFDRVTGLTRFAPT